MIDFGVRVRRDVASSNASQGATCANEVQSIPSCTIMIASDFSHNSTDHLSQSSTLLNFILHFPDDLVIELLRDSDTVDSLTSGTTFPVPFSDAKDRFRIREWARHGTEYEHQSAFQQFRESHLLIISQNEIGGIVRAAADDAITRSFRSAAEAGRADRPR
jgi:hypothetical protein